MAFEKTIPIHSAPDELFAVCHALNEVCNGIELGDEFETRMGVSLESARALLARLSGASRTGQSQT